MVSLFYLRIVTYIAKYWSAGVINTNLMLEIKINYYWNLFASPKIFILNRWFACLLEQHVSYSNLN